MLLLRDAAQTSGMTLETYENITYQHTLTQEANLKILENAAKDLFRQKANLQVSETTHFYESIVQYIKDHFDDQTISLASLAEEFCMSERFTSKAILSVSGSNFSKILLTARMEEAARLLRETDRSIPEISERCGYPAISTFYRNFKGYYHKTPAEYKEAYSDRKMDKNHS